MFINVNLVLAQQITLKNDKFVTELSIKVNPEYLASYYRGDNNITIRFKSKVKLNLIKLPENPFIEEINSNNNVLNVQIKNNINTYIEKNQNGLTIILAKSKQFDNLLKTEINPPIMVENDTNIINNEAENMLIKIDDAISRKNYLKAVNMIQEFLKTNPNGFYAIEAYYKLGETYMKMGDTSNRYYEISAEIFDNFTEKYPYYFRYNDALWNAAEASYKSHNYNKSLNYYNMVYEKQPSSDRGKIALYRIGDIYKDIGLYDKAIFTFIDYLNKYDKNNANIKNIIGYLYAKVNDYVSAYEYFYDFIKQGRFDFEKPDILFEIAKTLENKSLFDDALNVYKYIYTDKKDSTFADDSMFKSAMIYEKKGDYKLTDELLLNCKNSYPNSEGGYSCSLYSANKHLYEKEPDYW
jgi:TolA-binding protein